MNQAKIDRSLRGDGRALRLGLLRIGRADQREKQHEAHIDAREQLLVGVLRFGWR